MGVYRARLLLLMVLMLLIHGCAGVAERKPERPAANLVAEAERNLQEEKYGQAELQVERALRIDPRNGRIWNLMARIRFAQGNYGQAVQFCFKSNTLAGRDHALLRENWMLLEEAYTRMGDPVKAEEAKRKASAR